MNQQAHIYIIGDVIGIGFRAWTKIQSKQFHVTGWVRNNFQKPEVFGAHGGVEMVLQGAPHNINAMMEKVKEGPAIARIDDTEVYWEDVKESFPTFEIRK